MRPEYERFAKFRRWWRTTPVPRLKDRNKGAITSLATQTLGPAYATALAQRGENMASEIDQVRFAQVGCSRAGASRPTPTTRECDDRDLPFSSRPTRAMWDQSRALSVDE